MDANLSGLKWALPLGGSQWDNSLSEEAGNRLLGHQAGHFGWTEEGTGFPGLIKVKCPECFWPGRAT